MGKRASTAIMAAEELAGVASEVNLDNLLCTGNGVCKKGNPPWP